MVQAASMTDWSMRKPELDQIRADLRSHYPNLHTFINHDGFAQIAGAFPIHDAQGKELDRYSISILLPHSYPKDLPIVYEVGGRIPYNSDFHINPDGSACVLIPEDRWRCFPEHAPFLQYLDVPLYNFFLSQTYYAEYGQWPFGQWSHGSQGVSEYYRHLIGSENDQTLHRFLYILKKNNLKKHYDCPCGSGLQVKKCCLIKIKDLRSKILPSSASNALLILNFDKLKIPYRRSHLN
jgi:hypothetical protein